MNKTRIRLTKINNDKLGWNSLYINHYLSKTLLLRYARAVGDEEVVNNFVLGQLNRAKENGLIDFEKI